MQTTTLRKVGGSIMMTVPPNLLEELHLQAGSTVEVVTQGYQLVVRPSQPRYTMEELLAQCDPNAPMSDEDREWLNSPPVGRELI